jgi:hypothetical protein
VSEDLSKNYNKYGEATLNCCYLSNLNSEKVLIILKKKIEALILVSSGDRGMTIVEVISGAIIASDLGVIRFIIFS